MNWTGVKRLIIRWQQISLRGKIISLSLLVICLTGGSLLLYWIPHILNESESEEPEGPYAIMSLRIKDERVYTNGTVIFTVACHFKSYGGYPIPKEDLYNITKVFICTKDDILEFDPSLGEIQDVTKIKVLTGDLSLAVDDEVRLKFETSFPLQSGLKLYIGVFSDGPIGKLTRWDLYTTVLSP
ncbi:MAG: hypothetical protein ACFFDC_11610 [Promethearchaeota archaeon]